MSIKQKIKTQTNKTKYQILTKHSREEVTLDNECNTRSKIEKLPSYAKRS